MRSPWCPSWPCSPQRVGSSSGGLSGSAGCSRGRWSSGWRRWSSGRSRESVAGPRARPGAGADRVSPRLQLWSPRAGRGADRRPLSRRVGRGVVARGDAGLGARAVRTTAVADRARRPAARPGERALCRPSDSRHHPGRADRRAVSPPDRGAIPLVDLAGGAVPDHRRDSVDDARPAGRARAPHAGGSDRHRLRSGGRHPAGDLAVGRNRGGGAVERPELDGVPATALARRWGVPQCGLFRRVASTLDGIHELAAQHAPPGTVIIAEEQTAGRGQVGRTWHSPPGGVWLGMLLQPAHGELGVMSIRAGLVLADVVDELAGRPVAQLKWPNDVVIMDRKVAGILCEGRWQGDALQWLGLGIGVNVSNPLPAEVADRAIALQEILPAVRRLDLLDRLVPALLRLTAHAARL